MKQTLLVVFLLSFVTGATWASSECNGKTRGVKRGIVAEGDTERRVLNRMGEPDRTVQLHDGRGNPVGVEWVWYVHGHNPRTVRIWISGGKAQRVCDKMG